VNAAARRWIPALAPGLVLVLIAAQIPLGVRGFHLPHGGLWGALELPGRLLGWGGVALLLPLFTWLLLGMWGYSVTGMALKMLGGVTLALSVGGLAALAGGEAAGGRIGGPLADLLSQSLGGVVATIVLLLMAAPGVLLASARFQLGPPSKRASPTLAAPTLSAPKRAQEQPSPGPSAPPAARTRGWYPERRFDAEGNELPMEFGNAKDVGGIRYRDEEPRARAPEPARGPLAAPPAAPAPEPPAARDEPAPGAPAWPKGLVHAEGEDDAGEREDEPPTRAAVPNAAERLRPAAARPTSPKERGRVQPAPDEAAPEAPKRVFARSLFPKNPGDPVLIPGVRYRDEPEPPPAPAAPPPAPPPPPAAAPPAAPPPPAPRREAAPTSSLPARREAPSRAPSKPAPSPPVSKPSEPDLFPHSIEPAPPPAPTPDGPRRGTRTTPAPAPAPAASPPREPRPPAERDDAVPFGGQADNSRYQSKLAASGIFDEPAAPPAATPRPSARAAPEPETAPEGVRTPAPPARKGTKRASKPPPAPEPEPPPVAAPTARPKGAWVQELGDPVFVKAVEASLERGAASAVLLTRRLGLGYGKAQALIERLAKTGVLGEVSPTGARPVLITREELDGARS
jgi:hypothetical protein